DAQAVGAKYVDAIGLAQRPNFASVMHRYLFGDHHDLLELRIDAHELCNTVADAGRGQVDNAGVERMPVIDPFADIVVSGNITCRRRQHLAASPRRSPEHNVPAGKRMADRRHLSRFAAQNVEDADSILSRGDPVERADPEIVGKTLDASFEHARPPTGVASYLVSIPDAPQSRPSPVPSSIPRSL